MSILEKYFINWYIKLAYFGNFTYSCFLIIWLIGITYELYGTFKKLKRLPYLDIEDSKFWKKYYKNRIFKLAIMLVIIIFEGVQVALSQMDALYIPIQFPLYGNETSPVRFNSAYANILYCFGTNKFVPVGLVVFSIKITVFLYIIWTYSLCLNYCSMAYTNHIEYRKLCKPTVKWVILSSLAPFLMVSNYTVLIGVLSYFMLTTIAAINCIMSQKQLIRTLQAKRFDLNQESSKRQVRKIDKELRCVKNIGGIVICIGLVKIFSNFFCGSIGNVIIPIARNPCWIQNSNRYHGSQTQVEAITIIIAQAVFSIGKLVNMSYVMIVLAMNVLVGCLYFYVRKIQLDRIVKKKYTTYGKSLTRGLIR